jgi:hypothetical protein
MNLKIVLAVSIAFIIAFGSLYFTINFSQNSERVDYKKEFFSNQLTTDKNKILLLGSSHIGHLNMTHITNEIIEKKPDFIVYNLANNGDTPKIRHNDLDQIINLEPKLVFYGISYRDFNELSKLEDSQIIDFDIKNSIEKSIPEELKSINPQLLTRKAIRTVLDDLKIIEKPTYDIRPPNTPFFALGELQTKIISEDELKRQLLIVLPEPSKIQINLENENVKKFYNIIEKLHENKIKTVVFTTPVHDIYLNEISDTSINIFNDIKKEISEKNNIKIYDFEKRYFELEIWNNLDHIAYNKKSVIFSDEVANMIIEEIIP